MIHSEYVSVPVYRVVKIIKTLEGYNNAVELVNIGGKFQKRDPEVDDLIRVLKKIIKLDE